jgi:hypothetical protein
LALGRLADAEGELAFLQSAKSEYADQLAMSIGLYKQQNNQAEKSSSGN